MWWWEKMGLKLSIDDTINAINQSRLSGIDNPLEIWILSKHLELVEISSIRLDELSKKYNSATKSYYRLQYNAEINGIYKTLTTYVNAFNGTPNAVQPLWGLTLPKGVVLDTYETISDWRLLGMGLKGVYVVIINEGSKNERNIECAKCNAHYFIILSNDSNLISIRCIYCCEQAIYKTK